jgi:hypothetical protein
VFPTDQHHFGADIEVAAAADGDDDEVSIQHFVQIIQHSLSRPRKQLVSVTLMACCVVLLRLNSHENLTALAAVAFVCAAGELLRGVRLLSGAAGVWIELCGTGEACSLVCGNSRKCCEYASDAAQVCRAARRLMSAAVKCAVKATVTAGHLTQQQG